MKNNFKFTREDRRQGKRESESIQKKFDSLVEVFEELLFQDDCPDLIFEQFHLEWMKISEEYLKSKNRVSIANPRAFHDYAISHSEHIYDLITPVVPQYINPIVL